MKPLPPPLRQRATPPPPAVSGLSADALARLTPTQISARNQAAADRAAAAARRATVQRLAARVAATPPPKPRPTPASKLRQRTSTAPPAPAPTRPRQAAQPDLTSAQADLLVRFADAYDAGQPVHVGLTPDEVAVAYAHGRRLRAERRF